MPLRIGILTTWNTRCGIAEYSRHLVDAMHRHGDAQITVFSSRNYGERAVAPNEDWVKPSFDVQVWHPRHRFALDVEGILEHELDVLHVQYSNLFYDRGRLIELLQGFSGVTALTYHDKAVGVGFPYELLDLLYAHRPDVGIGPRQLIPQGIDLRKPVVKTFGLGKSRIDVISSVCERNGWDFQYSFGENRWLQSEELFLWLRDCDAIVLWYDDDHRSGGSAGAPLAIGTRRPVFVNDTEWFRDLPERTANLRKVHTVKELELGLREALDEPYAEGRTWDCVAKKLLEDFAQAVAQRSARVPHRSEALRSRLFVTLDHKPLRRVLRQTRSLSEATVRRRAHSLESANPLERAKSLAPGV